MKNIKLKIKAKHIALEPKIIKQEESKLGQKISHYSKLAKKAGKGPEFLDAHRKMMDLVYEQGSLQGHRRLTVSVECRATELARAFIEDRPYKSVERSRKPEREVEFQIYVMKRLVKIVSKYAPVRKYNGRFVRDEESAKIAIDAWLNAA